MSFKIQYELQFDGFPEFFQRLNGKSHNSWVSSQFSTGFTQACWVKCRLLSQPNCATASEMILGQLPPLILTLDG